MKKHYLYFTELLDDFNSQETIHDKTVSVGLAINSTLQNAEEYVASIGVFEIIDEFIQSIGLIPRKINSFLSQALGATSDDEDSEIIVEEIEKELFDEENDNRPKRDTTNQDDEALEDVLKNELKFWNTMNLALQRERKMLE